MLDLSRNRSRRFCSTACSNRNAVAAYRARQAGAWRSTRTSSEAYTRTGRLPVGAHAPRPWVCCMDAGRATRVAARRPGPDRPGVADRRRPPRPPTSRRSRRTRTSDRVRSDAARPLDPGRTGPPGPREAKEAEAERDVARRVDLAPRSRPAPPRPDGQRGRAAGAPAGWRSSTPASASVLRTYDEARVARRRRGVRGRGTPRRARRGREAAKAAAAALPGRSRADDVGGRPSPTRASQIGALGLRALRRRRRRPRPGRDRARGDGPEPSPTRWRRPSSRGNGCGERPSPSRRPTSERAGQARGVASSAGARRSVGPRPGARRRAHGPSPARGRPCWPTRRCVTRTAGGYDGALCASRCLRARRSSTSTTGVTAAATGPRCTPGTTSPPRAARRCWPSTTAPW